MQLFKFPTQEVLQNIISRKPKDNSKLLNSVQEKIELVRKKGDSAFPKTVVEITKEEFESAEKNLPLPLKQAIEMCRRNIWKIHIEQQHEEKEIQTSPGVFCTIKASPIERVGFYVDEHSFSSVLMLGVPAQIAECKEVILCTPPDKSGNIRPEILFAAKTVGIHRIFKLGGAEAIAAMAYGTGIVPKVMKIFGKGNDEAGIAKQLVALDNIAIDAPYGASELAIIIDETAVPAFVAADLISQADSEPNGKILLFTTNENIISDIQEQIDLQLASLGNKELIKHIEEVEVVLLKTLDEIVKAVNKFAPQKLIISTHYYMGVAANITNAGVVYLGNYAPECAGNYASGINHFIPSGEYISMFNGVNLDMFLRKIPFQQISKEGLVNLSNAINIFSETEGYAGRKNALDVRLDFDDDF